MDDLAARRVKVRFDYPKGSEGWQRDVEMLTVPREGESVCFGNADDCDEHYVRHVMHTPEDPEHQVYIVLQVSRG